MLQVILQFDLFMRVSNLVCYTREGHRLRVVNNTVMRKLGHKRDKVTEGERKLHKAYLCHCTKCYGSDKVKTRQQARGDLEKHGSFNWKQMARKYEGEVGMDRIPFSRLVHIPLFIKKENMLALSDRGWGAHTLAAISQLN
jgi:hypothetical protein